METWWMWYFLYEFLLPMVCVTAVALVGPKLPACDSSWQGQAWATLLAAASCHWCRGWRRWSGSCTVVPHQHFRDIPRVDGTYVPMCCACVCGTQRKGKCTMSILSYCVGLPECNGWQWIGAFGEPGSNAGAHYIHSCILANIRYLNTAMTGTYIHTYVLH